MAFTFMPSASAVYTCGVPWRAEMNAMRPLGRHRGESSLFGLLINGLGGTDPSAATIQMSELRFPTDKSVVVRTNNTRRWSDESCGSAIRTALSKSSSAMGRLAWASTTVAGTIVLAQMTSPMIERKECRRWIPPGGRRMD
jgi:hypothetical protein